MPAIDCICGGTVGSAELEACSGYRLDYQDNIEHYWFIECQRCSEVGSPGVTVAAAVANWNHKQRVKKDCNSVMKSNKVLP